MAVRPDPRRYRPRFFVRFDEAELPTTGERVFLTPEDSRHASSVLRLRPGEICEVVTLGTEGEGRLFGGRFLSMRPQAEVVLGHEMSPTPSRLHLTLVQALTQPRLIETIVEKGTEVGVDRFVIVPTEESPRVAPSRLQSKSPRWDRIALEAAKQSKQVGVPPVRIMSVSEIVELLDREGTESLLLEPSASRSLREHLLPAAGNGLGDRLALWVGPESGWSDGELEKLSGTALPVTLGRRILRAETAGPVAAALVRFVAGDW